MPGIFRATAGLFREAFERCLKHNTSLLSAALAFYSLLSLAPALYLLVAGAGVVIGRRAASGAVMDWATQMLGTGGGAFIGGVLERNGSGSSFATIVGIATLLYGATVAFGALQDALNLVWEVPPPAHGLRARGGAPGRVEKRPCGGALLDSTPSRSARRPSPC